jgi:prolipoprotein diacylglyceryltransferase
VISAPHLTSEAARNIHLFFEWAGLAIGAQIYRVQRLRAGQGGFLAPGTFAIVLGCVLGAAIGNELVFWIEWPQLWQDYGHSMEGWLSGQSIVGALVGGLFGVWLAKLLSGIRQPTGDQFILPLIVGTVVGRFGCFLAGLNDTTFGLSTSMPWAIDFGDGIPRHPTQIYDMLFVTLWGGTLLRMRARLAPKPGLAFKLFVAGFLLWRALEERINFVPYEYVDGLSGIQLVCIVALIVYAPLLVHQWRQPVQANAP